MRVSRWIRRLVTVAAIALPLIWAAAAQAESGCHRHGPPGGGDVRAEARAD